MTIVFKEFNKVIPISEIILDTIKTIWEECPSDLCIQAEDFDHIIFGSINRVVWTVYTGFRIEKTYCTTQFINHYHKVMEN